ncbi:MAG: antibiotic biosynthesis monooxygenase [Kiritimatiellia bacterium]|nr:antibiotic biosynthesis monooxygenase [Kiritimatiellia bacterium]
MTTEHPNNSAIQEGATAVTTHRIHSTHQAEYESWLDEIGSLCKTYPGHLDVQIISPIDGLTGTYTVIIRFDTCEHLKNWMYSEDRKRLIDKVEPFLATDDDFFISSGLDFWFLPDGARAKVPVRWKQVLITWSAIYPLVLGIPLIMTAIFRYAGLPEVPLVDTLISTGLIAILMAYFVMPRYTKLVKRWLFK